MGLGVCSSAFLLDPMAGCHVRPERDAEEMFGFTSFFFFSLCVCVVVGSGEAFSPDVCGKSLGHSVASF